MKDDVICQAEPEERRKQEWGIMQHIRDRTMRGREEEEAGDEDVTTPAAEKMKGKHEQI